MGRRDLSRSAVILAVLAATLATRAAAAAPPCHEGDVEARSNADLAVLADVPCLRGSLTITNDVTSLRPLRKLAEIEGDLFIVRVDSLASLRGLDALTRVRGNVHIGGPKMGIPKIRVVDGLPALVEIGGDLWIGGGYVFHTPGRGPKRSRMSPIHGVRGLASLAIVRGDVELFDLHGFRGLNALTTIGGALTIDKGKLVALGGFARLATIGGTLTITSTHRLRRIDGLRALTSIGGDVDVGCSGTNDLLEAAVVRRRLAKTTVKGTFWYALPGDEPDPSFDREPDRTHCPPESPPP